MPILDRFRRGVGTATPNQVLAIVCVGICLANLDLFIVNVALPNIAQDFGHASLDDMSWVLNAYAIAYAALLVFFGRLAERYRRNMSFLLGVGLGWLPSLIVAAFAYFLTVLLWGPIALILVLAIIKFMGG